VTWEPGTSPCLAVTRPQSLRAAAPQHGCVARAVTTSLARALEKRQWPEVTIASAITGCIVCVVERTSAFLAARAAMEE